MLPCTAGRVSDEGFDCNMAMLLAAIVEDLDGCEDGDNGRHMYYPAAATPVTN